MRLIQHLAHMEFRKHCQQIKWLVLAQIGKLIPLRKSNGALVILLAVTVILPMPKLTNAPTIGTNMITLFMGPMQVLPTPNGLPVPNDPARFTTVWTGNFQTDLNNVLAAMRAKGYTQLATQFRQLALQEHAKNPALPVSTLLAEFIGIEAAGGIGTGIGQTGTILGQIPGAAAKGAENAVDKLGGFNLSGWFLRIGEILLGLVLVGVGVARITGAQNAISKIVRTKLPL